jgi:hypothetical protein
MATCPQCGASSRTDPTFVVTEEIIGVPVDTEPDRRIGGPVFDAEVRLRLSHERCGWSILGEIRDGAFYGDPATSSSRGVAPASPPEV